jgi:hypothetical protein
LTAAALVVLLSCGVGIAAVTSGTTRTYTYTVPGTTVAIPDRVYTQTVQVPTVTDTETVTNTVTVTAPSTTTAPTTTTASAPTYAEAISYTNTRPAFTPARTIDVTSASQLENAVANIQAGDLIRATAQFTVQGQWTIANHQLSAPAVIDLGSTLITYTGSQNYDAVWLTNDSNLRFYGGEVTNPNGNKGIDVYGTSNVLWWGFTVHDTGGDGLSMFPIGGDITGDDFQGEVSRWSENLTWDPHTEAGTGLHGANLGDAGTAYAFSNNRVALYTHDGAGGSAVELGDADGSPVTGDTLILKAEYLTKDATKQVAGNGLQLWGGTKVGLDVPYIEVNHAEGRAVDTNGAYASMAGVNVAYGRASDTNRNPALASTEPISPDAKWDPRQNPTYADVNLP